MFVELLGSLALAAECPDGPIAPARIAELLDGAERAFVDLEIPVFISRTDAVRAAIPCLASAAESALVARIHRAEGLRLFGERNVDAVRAFAAARTLEPGYVFPTEVVPDGSPILDDYSAMDLDAAEAETLPEPLVGVLLVDGRPSRERPLAWPALIQLLPAEDAPPELSVYLRHDAPRPLYATLPEPIGAEPALAPTPVPVVEAPDRLPRVPLLVAAGASAVVSGALYGAAWASRGAYFDPETPDSRLPTLRARTNGLTVASAAGGAATLALGAAVALSW